MKSNSVYSFFLGHPVLKEVNSWITQLFKSRIANFPKTLLLVS